jgi:hypothetical protein
MLLILHLPGKRVFRMEQKLLSNHTASSSTHHHSQLAPESLLTFSLPSELNACLCINFMWGKGKLPYLENASLSFEMTSPQVVSFPIHSNYGIASSLLFIMVLNKLVHMQYSRSQSDARQVWPRHSQAG